MLNKLGFFSFAAASNYIVLHAGYKQYAHNVRIIQSLPPEKQKEIAERSAWQSKCCDMYSVLYNHSKVAPPHIQKNDILNNHTKTRI